MFIRSLLHCLYTICAFTERYYRPVSLLIMFAKNFGSLTMYIFICHSPSHIARAARQQQRRIYHKPRHISAAASRNHHT